MHIRLNINGSPYDVDVPPQTSLLGVLRDDLGLTGARYGCGHGVCGACFVLIDGRAVASCVTGLDEIEGKAIVTVEGLAEHGELHPLQHAFIAEDAMQCGACTSGMLISAAALLTQNPHPDDGEIRLAMAPHLCRCGVYLRVERAIKRAIR